MVKRGLILGGVLALFGCASAYAEGAEFSIDVSSATLQLTVPESVSIELQPTSSAAVFDSKPLTFNVATNNPTGYRVIMSVPQTEMLHSSIATANIPTLSSTTTEANFPANKWGFKTTGDYNPINLSNEDSAWNNDNPTNGTNHSLTLAAKVDGSQVAGIYTNTLTFTAVVNPNAPKDTIIFNANSANATGTMTSQTIFRGEPTVLNTNNYTLEGYSFMGWNTMADGTGEGYGDGDIYTDNLAFTATTTNITLYAQWQEGGSGGYAGRTLQAAFEQAYVNNPGNFPKDGGGTKHGLYVPHKNNQGEYDGTYFEATSQSDYDGIPADDLRFAIQHIGMLVDGEKVCERTTVIGSSAYVLDLRDNKSYWITKLKDGKCWMTQNLDLDLDSSKALSHELSDIGYGSDDSTMSWTPERSTIPKTSITQAGYVNTWQNKHRVPYSLDTGNYYWTDTWYGGDCSNAAYNCNYIAGGQDKFSQTPYPNNQKHGHVGNYYNWPAAIASNNTSAYTTDTSSDTTLNPQNSICPAGWRLPISTHAAFNAVDPQDDFMYLAYLYRYVDQFNLMNDVGITRAPIWLVRGGLIWDNVLKAGGAGGGYWTSTVGANGENAYLAGFDATNNNSNSYWSYIGRSIRCIAR